MKLCKQCEKKLVDELYTLRNESYDLKEKGDMYRVALMEIKMRLGL